MLPPQPPPRIPYPRQSHILSPHDVPSLSSARFCVDCLKNYAQEKLFGQSNSERLQCMDSSGGCAGYYPEDELLQRWTPRRSSAG